MLTKAQREQGYGPDGQPAGRFSDTLTAAPPWQGTPKECRERKASDPLPLKEQTDADSH